MTNHIFHPSILRAYDIRGIIDETLSIADAWKIEKNSEEQNDNEPTNVPF